MPKKTKKPTTRLYEVVISFAMFEEHLIFHVDEDEYHRLTSVLEAAYKELRRFYGCGLADGLGCYINTSAITKINILDYMGGLSFEKPPERSEAKWKQLIEEREESEDPMILRIWASGEQSIDVYHQVDYQEWLAIQAAMEESSQHFIGFTDEDGERVIFPVAKIAAIESYDTHYLSDEDIARIFKEEDGNDKPLE